MKRTVMMMMLQNPTKAKHRRRKSRASQRVARERSDFRLKEMISFKERFYPHDFSNMPFQLFTNLYESISEPFPSEVLVREQVRPYLHSNIGLSSGSLESIQDLTLVDRSYHRSVQVGTGRPRWPQ